MGREVNRICGPILKETLDGKLDKVKIWYRMVCIDKFQPVHLGTSGYFKPFFFFFFTGMESGERDVFQCYQISHCLLHYLYHCKDRVYAGRH